MSNNLALLSLLGIALLANFICSLPVAAWAKRKKVSYSKTLLVSAFSGLPNGLLYVFFASRGR